MSNSIRIGKEDLSTSDIEKLSEHTAHFLDRLPNNNSCGPGDICSRTRAVPQGHKSIDHQNLSCEDGVSLLDLPWEHVWFEWVLCRVSNKDLFLLRVSKRTDELVKAYFKYSFSVNLMLVAAKFNKEAFQFMTDESVNLRQLILKNTKDWLTDEVLMPVLENNSCLRRADLTDCNSITNMSLQVIAINCTDLREINLGGCHWVSPEGVFSLAFQCPGLEKVDLSGCWDIGDDAVITLVTVCKNLTSLSLGNIYGLTDESVVTIARCCTKLQHLNIKGCWRITDKAIRILSEYCKTLKGLQVRECRNITEISLCLMRGRKVQLDRPPKIVSKRSSMYPRLHLQT